MKPSRGPTHAGVFMASGAVLFNHGRVVKHFICKRDGLATLVTAGTGCRRRAMRKTSTGPGHAGIFMTAYAIALTALGVIKRRSASQPDWPQIGVTARALSGRRAVSIRCTSKSDAYRFYVAENAIRLSGPRVVKAQISGGSLGPVGQMTKGAACRHRGMHKCADAKP